MTSSRGQKIPTRVVFVVRAAGLLQPGKNCELIALSTGCLITQEIANEKWKIYKNQSLNKFL